MDCCPWSGDFTTEQRAWRLYNDMQSGYNVNRDSQPAILIALAECYSEWNEQDNRTAAKQAEADRIAKSV